MKVKTGKYLTARYEVVDVSVSKDNEFVWSEKQYSNKPLYHWYWYDGKSVTAPEYDLLLSIPLNKKELNGVEISDKTWALLNLPYKQIFRKK